jgi:hypothetical protein
MPEPDFFRVTSDPRGPMGFCSCKTPSRDKGTLHIVRSPGDLNRPVRSDPAITWHFLIDPATESNFIDQFSFRISALIVQDS